MNGVSSIPFFDTVVRLRGGPRYAALDRFVAGPENRLALVAAEDVLQRRGDFNPLVLYGPPASGKSHLAQGLANAWARRHGEEGLWNGTAAGFAQQWARAVHQGEAESLRRQLRTSKFMVLEDLTSLAGKAAAQEELIHTLDALLDQGAQVIATSREPLARMTFLRPGLRSRLAAGLEVPLAWPDLAARSTLIEEVSAARGTPFTKTAARLLAEGIKGSVPELVGAITAIESARRNANGEPVSPADVEQYLAGRAGRPAIGMQQLCALTARYFGLKAADLKSASRQRPVVLARGIAMFLARQYTGKTLQQIGRYFGGRDHSTVLHGCRQIQRLVHSDAETRQAVEDLREQLSAWPLVQGGSA